MIDDLYYINIYKSGKASIDACFILRGIISNYSLFHNVGQYHVSLNVCH